MGTRVLVGLNATAVEQLLQTLDSEYFPLVAAFWREATDESDGEIVIVSPEVDRIGSLAVYERIQGMLAHLPDHPLTLDDVKVVGERDPMMARLRRAVPSGFPIEQFDVRITVPDDTSDVGAPVNLHIYRWRLSNERPAVTRRG
jgi:hypothetical protein